MSQTVLKKLKFASVSIFLLGAITAAVAYSVKHARTPKAPLGFTIISRQTFTPADTGKPLLKADIERYQKSDGSWVLMHTYYRPDGAFDKANKVFGELGRGVFQIDENKKTLSFLSPMASDKPIYSEDAFVAAQRKNPRFLREELVLGYKALVLGSQGEDGVYDQAYYAPALQGMVIKHVWTSPMGVEVIEPTKITLGDPSDSAFATATDYPVDYKHFEKKIEASEKAGRPEVAEQMRQQLHKQKPPKQ